MWIIVTKSLGERMGEKDRNGRRDKENIVRGEENNGCEIFVPASKSLDISKHLVTRTLTIDYL